MSIGCIIIAEISTFSLIGCDIAPKTQGRSLYMGPEMTNIVYALLMGSAGIAGGTLGWTLTDNPWLKLVLMIIFAIGVAAAAFTPIHQALELDWRLRYPEPGAIGYHGIVSSTMNVLKIAVAASMAVALAALSVGSFLIASSMYSWSTLLATGVCLFGMAVGLCAISTVYLAFLQLQPTHANA